MFPRQLIVILGLSLLMISIAYASLTESEDNDDAIKFLQQLDRYYSFAGRPRLTRSEVQKVQAAEEAGEKGPEIGDDDEAGLESPNLARAVRLLQLHSLDKLYSHHTRPRFGKRTIGNIQWERNNPDQILRLEN